jgi:PAS domain S-box-containing protein
MRPLTGWEAYGFALIATLVTVVFRLAIHPIVHERIAYVLFYVTAMVVAWRAGFRPALLTLTLGGLLAWYLFVPPSYSLAFVEKNFLASFGFYYVFGVALAYVTNRQQTESARAEENARIVAVRQQELEAEIQERKRAESQRDLALEAARLGIWEWDLATNHVRWSENLESLHGLPHGGFDGTLNGYQRVVHPDDWDRMQQALAQSLKTGEDYELEFRVVWPNNSIHWMAGAARVLRSPEGEVRGMVGVGIDIDARKQVEQELQIAYDRERRIAETLQRSLLLLPERQSSIPGLEISPQYEAARDEAEVGGDFYDVVPLGDADDAVVLVVGDVSGKGLGAAAHTAEIKFVLRGYLHEDRDNPESALTRLNTYLCAASTVNPSGLHLYALCIVRIEPQTGKCRAAIAGAELPLLIPPSSSPEPPFLLSHPGGMPLGIDPTSTYPGMDFTLRPDEALVLYTDGITEARNGREFFGADGLLEVAATLQEQEGQDMTTLGAEIVEAAKAFSASGKLRDDVCLLACRRVEGKG